MLFGSSADDLLRCSDGTAGVWSGAAERPMECLGMFSSQPRYSHVHWYFHDIIDDDAVQVRGDYGDGAAEAAATELCPLASK